MKTAFITGATVNTGYGIAEKFLTEGWRAVITSRSEEQLDAALKSLGEKYGKGRVSGYVTDVVRSDNTVDEDRLDFIFSDLDEKGITVDCLVLNAANLGIRQRIFDNPLSDFINVINTNVVMNYALVERAARRMKDKGEGSVVFINSNTAYRAIPDRIAYSTSKSAQLGMMRALALDLGKYNIRVNAVLPGMIKTDRWEKNPEFYAKVPSRFTPIGDVAVGEDIADAVYYFAAHARNTTGAELVVDGGNTIQLYPTVPKG